MTILLFERVVYDLDPPNPCSYWQKDYEVFKTEQEAQAEATRLRASPGSYRNVQVFEGREIAPKP